MNIPLRRLVACLSLCCLYNLVAAEKKSGFAKAWQEIGFLNYKGASGPLEKIQERAQKGSDEWINATLGLAVCLHHRQPDVQADKDRAGELYESLIEATAGKPVQAFALLQRARLAEVVDYFEDVPEPDKARELYQKLIQDWPSSAQVHQAVLYRGQLAIYSMDPAQAVDGVSELKSWLASHPDNPLASLQWMLVALAYTQPLNEPLQAVDAYLQAERVGLPETIKLDSYYWCIANLAEKGGDRKTASKYYRLIVTEGLRSSFAYEAQLRIKGMGEVPPPLVDPFAEAPNKPVNQEGKKL
jgi:tetratricopeptide (TPR) repeat protein